METRRIRVKGRVQGVGFRYALRDEAERLGVTGWVRNCADGSVEALLQGQTPAVELLVAWARRGPPAAHVSALEEQALGRDADPPYERFAIRPNG
jgi:acylphosphatase